MATNFPSDQAIVVGGGLAGVSAANTIVECGGRVVLLDKSSFCGGNSTKATSGINGSDTKSQRAKGIKDSKELFTSDTLKGGAKKPELVEVAVVAAAADDDDDVFDSSSSSPPSPSAQGGRLVVLGNGRAVFFYRFQTC